MRRGTARQWCRLHLPHFVSAPQTVKNLMKRGRTMEKHEVDGDIRRRRVQTRRRRLPPPQAHIFDTVIAPDRLLSKDTRVVQVWRREVVERTRERVVCRPLRRERRRRSGANVADSSVWRRGTAGERRKEQGEGKSCGPGAQVGHCVGAGGSARRCGVEDVGQEQRAQVPVGSAGRNFVDRMKQTRCG